MRRLHGRSAGRPIRARRAGFTLVEILTATLLALVMMAIVTQMFGDITDAVNQNRASIEMRGQLRGVVHRLQKDLEGYTAKGMAPLDPALNLGYIEIVEGPIGPIYWPGDPTRTVLASAAPQVFDGTTKLPNSAFDTTLGDRDDIIMFTTRSRTEPFRAASINAGANTGTGANESNEAEVCWFLRGTTLYRRLLLVGSNDPRFAPPPQLTTSDTSATPVRSSAGAYKDWDLSVREANVATGNPAFYYEPRAGATDYMLVPNTLGDLTKRENRYAHQTPLTSAGAVYPFDVRYWGDLGLPTLTESSNLNWPLPAVGAAAGAGLPSPLTSGGVGGITKITLTGNGVFDPRNNRFPWASTQIDQSNGQVRLAGDKQRGAEDVVLTNVLKFDVKVWDPGAPTYLNANNQLVAPGDPAYLTYIGGGATGTLAGYGAWVDLNYMCLLGPTSGASHVPNYTPPGVGTLAPSFHGPGNPLSQLVGQLPATTVTAGTAAPSVYDTWSTHYESDGQDQSLPSTPGAGLIDEGTNGFDDNGFGGVDDAAEKEAPPPYAAPLRGVQITIAVFEPDTQEIREVTVVQDFIR